MDYRPNLQYFPGSTELLLRPTGEARRLVAGAQPKAFAKPPERVREEAKERIRLAGGDPEFSHLVLSESQLQFGQYQGQTFRWLLGNDVGYAAALLASHQVEKEGGKTSRTALDANKEALSAYAKLFPAVVETVAERRMCDGTLSVRGMDRKLVAVGGFVGRTFQSLYEANDTESRGYINWLKRSSIGPGSRMYMLQVYMRSREREDEEGAGPSSSAPQTAPQPPSGAGEMSDTKLLAASMEVKSQCERVTVTPTRSLLSGAKTLPLRLSVSGAAPPADDAAAPPADDAAAPPAADDAAAPPADDADAPPADDAAAPPVDDAAAPLPGRPVQLTAAAPPAGAELLPKGWRKTLPEEQQDWLGRALFTRGAGGQPVLTSELRLWWFPPADQPLYSQPPASPNAFFRCRFFLWMPYRMWAYKLACPNCGHRLTGAGLYRTVRRVLDFSSWYFMGTEYLECCSCRRKFAAWVQDIMEQLDPAHRLRFPAILTYKLCCDRHVLGFLYERTLGNSATRLRATLVERHTTEWMSRTMAYLVVLRNLGVRGLPERQVTVPPMQPVPTVRWLLSVYARDAHSRVQETKAKVTSVFGSILKMDSTKKMTKKLAGEAAGTAAWVTNVGNEHGQVLMSVLTASKGEGLQPMADGLVRRYRDAGKTPPRVLYVGRDCCSKSGQCKVAAMFGEWDGLVVRLDAWHLMRRFARGVTTESHPLYGLFMARLSFAIFEWDQGDVRRLKEAKEADGRGALAPTAKELARHCRRCTRGQVECERLIQELLDSMWEAVDTMGVRLIDSARMEDIWNTQRRHLSCIQDPEGVSLYTQTGHVMRGGVRLPVYRCARGSTSLESFHLHLCRFIPGTSASALHFQVYLLEGLVRWNEDRARAAVQEAERDPLRCYNSRMVSSLNELTQRFMGCTLVHDYTVPGEDTGELIGVEYLYSQTGVALQRDMGRDPDAPDGTEQLEEEEEEEEDKGDQEEPEDLRFISDLDTLLQPAQPPLGHGRVPPEEDDQDVIGPDGHGGYQHVVRLANALVELRSQGYVTQRQKRKIVALWQRLSDRDKRPVAFAPRHQERLVRGGFKAGPRRQAGIAAVDSVKRGMIRQGAPSPGSSRLVEAVFLELCRLHHECQTVAGIRLSRWRAVMRDYALIRDSVFITKDLTAAAPIQLYDVNHRTLLQWYTQRSKAMMAQTGPAVAVDPLPPAVQLQAQPQQQQPEGGMDWEEPMDASGAPTSAASTSAPPTSAASTSAASTSAPPTSAASTSAPPTSAASTSASPTSAASTSAASTSAPPTSAASTSAPPTSAASTSAPPTSAASTSAASTSAPPTSAASTSAASTSASPTSAASTSATAVPRSTAWYRKMKEEKRQKAEKAGLLFGPPVPPRKDVAHFLCRLCGQPKTKAHGHSRYRGESFCSLAAGRSVEEWLAEKRRDDAQKTKDAKTVVLPARQQAILPAPQPAILSISQPAVLPAPQPAVPPATQPAQVSQTGRKKRQLVYK